jgi:hypothetical protein
MHHSGRPRRVCAVFIIIAHGGGSDTCNDAQNVKYIVFHLYAFITLLNVMRREK